MEIHKIWHNGELVYDSTQKEKPDNRAPKIVKGDYDLSIHGNKIVLVDNSDGTTVEARCHPHDNFDVGEGMREAFKKLNEKREGIKVGDYVEVINWMNIYPIYSDFFIENKLEDLGKKFRYGSYLHNGDKLEVIYIKEDKFVLKRKEKIGSYGYVDCVYIMDNKGIRKAEND